MDTLLAPCGLDCGLCPCYIKTKDRCLGCLDHSGMPLEFVSNCNIVKCTMEHHITYCFECESFPCIRIKKLEKRYTTQHGESPLNLGIFVRENGFDAFRELQQKTWRCQNCGEGLNAYKGLCSHCGEKNPHFPK